MKKLMVYKGYMGKYVIEDDGYFSGNIPNVKNACITFGGETMKELRNDFKLAVEDYFEVRSARNKKPHPQTNLLAEIVLVSPEEYLLEEE